MCRGSVIPVEVYSQGELSTLVYLFTLFFVCVEAVGITEVCLVVGIIMLCYNLYLWTFFFKFSSL